MNPVLSQWLPVFVMLIAIWVGLLYNNKRLDDFRDLLRPEVGRAKAEMQAETLRSEQTILQAIAEMKAELKADIQGLDRRLQRLEAPLLRTQ
jgi:gamma-glutamylcysteine synthetase